MPELRDKMQPEQARIITSKRPEKYSGTSPGYLQKHDAAQH